MKKIGNILLDDTHYSGEDLYSDGAVEDKLLELVKKHPKESYHEVIVNEQDWAVMYHLAHERENILSWYPFTEGSKILEVGSGCGAVTGAVAGKAKSVTCIDLSMKRSTINAIRNQDRDNIKICVGNFKDIEKDLEDDFDYATLIGVFEYGRGYIGGKRPYHGFLSTIIKHIKPGGKLLIAIENKFGLKYWAGCTEDHVGKYFEGIEGYPDTESARTFTRPELVHIMEECGCKNYRFYYPYPDYKFPTVIYSDAYLPKIGELTGNICNFDRKRLVLMDEAKVFDEILSDGLFPLYSNSFFVEITKECEENALSAEQIIYTKYSGGRAPDFAIRTRIADGENGKLILYKTAEYPQGEKHIRHIYEAKEKLEEHWADRKMFHVNQSVLKGDKLFFEYLEGVTLEEELDRLLESGETEKALHEIEKIMLALITDGGTTKFQMTPEFREVFGEVSVPEFVCAAETADVDLIFSNILLDKDGNYHVLDYEWTFFFPVPAEFIAYRALHYYIEKSPMRQKLNKDFDLYERYRFVDDKKECYDTMERNFQRYIRGGYVSMGELYHTMGKKAVPLGELLSDADKRRIQVYLDYGEGFTEENSYFIDHGYEEEIRCTVAIPENVTGVWIDPALSACILKDVALQWENKSPVAYVTTGFEMEKNCYLFDNSDPKIIIEEIPQGLRRIQVSYRISILEEETAVMLMDKLNVKKRMKKKVRELLKG